MAYTTSDERDRAERPRCALGAAGQVQQWSAPEGSVDSRTRARAEMAQDAGLENLYFSSAGADGILLVGFKIPALKIHGKTLAEVAKERGTSPADTSDGPGDPRTARAWHGVLSDVGRKRAQKRKIALPCKVARVDAPTARRKATF